MREAARLVVVADASPLTGLARTGRLSLLRQLFGQILIPGAVEGELCLESNRPGSRVLAEAKKEGWLLTAPMAHSSVSSRKWLVSSTAAMASISGVFPRPATGLRGRPLYGSGRSV